MELGVYADPAHVTDRRPGVSSPFHGTSQPVGGGVKECNGSGPNMATGYSFKTVSPISFTCGFGNPFIHNEVNNSAHT